MVSSHVMPLIIAGSTGSGKSALALRLALKFNGEIICADSRQFYSHMCIGTASPSAHERALVPHHGFNIVDPRQRKIDAGFFVSFAHDAIVSCQKRGKRPIVVGGTGLYLRALRYGLHDVPQSDKAVLARLEEECETRGLHQLYEELALVDPASVQLILPQDRYRIVRALEIYRKTGLPPSALRKSFSARKSLIKAHWLLKLAPPDSFEERLKERVISMLDEGLVEEACQLRALLPEGHWALKVMGYEEALAFNDGLLDKAMLIEKIFIRHRQYARRQRKWFRNEGYHWQIR